MAFFKRRNKKVIQETNINTLKPDLKKIKVSNSIVVGGMIAFGKSTLAKKINEAIKDSQIVFELNDEDQLMNLLLQKMYERENNVLFGSLFQLYFVLNRFQNYKNNCNNKNITIFDRSIFEDWLFAHENIVRPSVFSYYDSLWKDVAYELIYEYGVPKLYVILTGDWNLFKERLFERNRKIEIDNYKKNETYFRKLLEIYEEYMVNVCKDFGIDYILVDANKPLEEKVEIVLNKIKSIIAWHKKINSTDSYRIENFINHYNFFNAKDLSSSKANEFIAEINKVLDKQEITVISMLNGLEPYASKKTYEEIANELTLSVAKIKAIEKTAVEKIKQLNIKI